jgi:hypothetical protein
MNKKIYISGAISGLPLDEVEKKFEGAEKLLAGQGYEVVNPLKTVIPQTEPWQVHIAIDIILLLGCDAIYLLPDWIYSKGATLERSVAEQTGKELIYQKKPELIELKNTIEEIMGISFYIIAAQKRDRIHVYARMMYAHFARLEGITIEKLATEMKRNHSTIIYYLRKFEDENKFNAEFRELMQKIMNKLNY